MSYNTNPEYLDLRKSTSAELPESEAARLEHLARLLRGLIFATVEAGQSGHAGGSSSKVEQLLAIFASGQIAFDPLNPKNPGRDRFIWSAGHCTPLLFSWLSLIYESLRRAGRQFSQGGIRAIFPEDLVRFRHVDGPQGHAESYYPLVDFSTGPSGHGFSVAGGMAITHKSCGLPTKVWVMMGDAESEEGMTYEARNILSTVGADNLIVCLDYNHFGIDGPIEEVISSPYANHWLGLGWNVIEADGHNIREMVAAYRRAAKGFGNGLPTVVLAHTLKGKLYANRENSNVSHGGPIERAGYIEAMKKLGFNVAMKSAPMTDIEKVLDQFKSEDEHYVLRLLEEAAKKIKPEAALVKQMEKALDGRPLVDPISLRRPRILPKELVFKSGDKVSTRRAAEAWFAWLMKQTAFFYIGAADVSHSMPTASAEKVYGIINRGNPLGRGMRFGIAEANMAMMASGLAADILPGGFHPVSAFGTFAVFTSMESNAVRLSIINNHLNPERKGFFVMIAGHDGPETGEDGPTHQGLYWMSYFQALPGIKVYKPADANETIEMLFYALEKGEPIVLSLSRPDTPVLLRGKGAPAAREAVNGAYVLKPFSGYGKKKIVLAVCGAYLLQNVLLSAPTLLKQGADVKIIVVTSPELFEELHQNDPAKAAEILEDVERPMVVTLHNGWPGFLNPFILPADYAERSIGLSTYLKSGSAAELYDLAGLDKEELANKISAVIFKKQA